MQFWVFLFGLGNSQKTNKKNLVSVSVMAGDDGEMFVDVFDSITQKQNDELMNVSFFKFYT